MKSWGQSKKEWRDLARRAPVPAASADGADAAMPLPLLPAVSPGRIHPGRLLGVFLALGLLVRLYLAMRGHPIRYADEIYQSLEQAHRIVFGYGIVPWEFGRHMRWMGLPLLMTLPQYLAAAMHQGPEVYLAIARAGVALLSLAPIPLLYAALQRRFGGRTAALACLIPLFWPENLDFSTSTLADAISAPLLCCTALLPLTSSRRGAGWAVAFAGCAALTCAVRFQLGPSVLLIALPAFLEMDQRGRNLLVRAIALWAVALALFDAATGLYPFQYVVENFRANILEGAAAGFGTDPWWYFLPLIASHWGLALPVALPLLALTTREHWRLSAPALLLIALLSAIDHKEYRFYFPATDLITMALGWAAASVMTRWLHDVPAGLRRTAVLALPILPLLLAAAQLTTTLRAHPTNLDLAQFAAGRLPETCGIGMAGAGDMSETNGYTYLHRDVPFDVAPASDLAQGRFERFNVLLFGPGDRPATVLRSYHDVACFTDPDSTPVCLAVRPGGCRNG